MKLIFKNLEHCVLPVGYQAILAVVGNVAVENREHRVSLSIVECFVAQGAKQ